MTSIKNFFPSSTILSPAESDIKSIPISRPDHKLIVSNMQSVINSVKMQKKAKKRKRNREEPQEIHDISKILKSNLSFLSPNRDNSAIECKEETSKESSTVETKLESQSDGISSIDNCSKENTDENTIKTCSQSSRDEEKMRSKTNAFEFMMTARNKSYATNSPGKEISNKAVSPETSKRDEVTVKRRIMLEEWAERKGGAKKKLIEAESDKYIDIVMKKRAKRLRTLIENGNKHKESESSDEDKVSPRRSNRKIVIKRGNKIVDSDDNNDDDGKDQHKSSTHSSINGKIKDKLANDEKFVEKLSSPLKKRDSLFGYFSKLTKSSNQNNIEATSEDISPNKTSKKKRGRSRKTLKLLETTDTSPRTDILTTLSPPITISDTSKPVNEERPKRLCRDKKISYFIDEDYTPLKSVVKKSKATKLAPIFAKATPKVMIDPVVLRARHEFLMSGIPEKMKLEIEKQRHFEELYEIEFEVFPKVSHVGYQIESNIDIDLDALNIRFRCESVENDENKFDFRQCILLKIEKSDSMHQLQQPSNKVQTFVGQKDVMRQLKSNDSSQFPYFGCFKQLKRKNSANFTEEEDGDSSVELLIDKVASTNGYLTFTEKYKPVTTEEVLINSKPLIELKKFLSSWQENEDRRQCSDSDDDFNTSSNSTFGMSSFNKAVVLSGPSGCGKTTFVYALANEMNFKVLEINAGAKRTGKRVLQKLQEATQSHHVNNNHCSQNDRLNVLKKKKLKSSQSDDSEDSGGNQKLSLILIEDAEVVFEQDFGFVESITTLINTTKRPVILITNQNNCAHLSRFISKNTIFFNPPKPATASKWFSTLSVLEQCYVTEDMFQSFYRQNNCDFRKTLLELQFFIQSETSQKNNNTDDEDGKLVACMTHNTLRDLFQKDQNRLDVVLPYPVDFRKLSNKSNEILKTKNVSLANDAKSDSLTNSLEFLNMLSTAQWLDHKTDCSDRVVNHLSEDINHFLVEQSLRTNLNWNRYCESASEEDSVSRHQLASIVSNPNYHSTRSFHIDVEPCLRSICRSEFKRSQLERRSSRFYIIYGMRTQFHLEQKSSIIIAQFSTTSNSSMF